CRGGDVVGDAFDVGAQGGVGVVFVLVRVLVVVFGGRGAAQRQPRLVGVDPRGWALLVEAGRPAQDKRDVRLNRAVQNIPRDVAFGIQHDGHLGLFAVLDL